MTSASSSQPDQSASPGDETNWDNMEKKFSHKSASQYYDPCQDYADRSLKCMRRNGFDKEMCGDYFQAYRDCKKHWVSGTAGVLFDLVRDHAKLICLILPAAQLTREQLTQRKIGLTFKKD